MVSGECLTFTDSVAKKLMENLDEETVGINYMVNVEKNSSWIYFFSKGGVHKLRLQDLAFLTT